MRAAGRCLAVLFCLAVGSALSQPSGADAAAGRDSAQALQTYLRGVSRVMQDFEAANVHVAAAGGDLSRYDYRAATADLGSAASGEQRARRELDSLPVPARAGHVQQLLDRAFAKFVSGVQMMHTGAVKRNARTFELGLRRYYQGAALLNQALPLVADLTQ